VGNPASARRDPPCRRGGVGMVQAKVLVPARAVLVNRCQQAAGPPPALSGGADRGYADDLGRRLALFMPAPVRVGPRPRRCR
jgi:hypothetical protein